MPAERNLTTDQARDWRYRDPSDPAKIVLYSSDEAAEPVRVRLSSLCPKRRGPIPGFVDAWLSRAGRLYTGGEAERLARYDGCTHRECSRCGEPAPKLRTACEKCIAAASRERHLALPTANYGDWPVDALFVGDSFFADEDELLEYLHDEGLHPAGVEIQFCKAAPPVLPDVDVWWEGIDAPEECDPPEALLRAHAVWREAVQLQWPEWYAPGPARPLRLAAGVRPDEATIAAWSSALGWHPEESHAAIAAARKVGNDEA
jgi:hypothetical protein